jgi:trehalose-6-phosphate synthase
MQIDPDQQVVICQAKLPIQLTKVDGLWKALPNQSVIANYLYNLSQKRNSFAKTVWIGHPGIYPKNEAERSNIEKFLRPYNCVPVFIDEDTFYRATVFHETLIRPLFHNFKSISINFEIKQLWTAYHEVNQQFANTVLQNLQFWENPIEADAKHKHSQSDLIWIHNTHLLLLPTLLRRKNQNANLGFSLHSPWPSSDIFKMFPYRMEVLKSIMCCDLISFHLFEYARNFYTGATRMLDLQSQFRQGGILGIEYHGRFVPLRVSHIGVDLKEIQSTINDKQTQLKLKPFKDTLQEKIKQRTIIFSSVDRNHIISGIKNKLLAFMSVLDSYPRIRNQLCLIQYCSAYECPSCLKEKCDHED